MLKMKLTELKKLEWNPRTIKKEDLDKLTKSIEKFWVIEWRPFLVSNRTWENVIIWGNQRYEVCKKLWIKEVPVHIMEWLTEEEEREIIIRDNISNWEWDWDILANEWDKEELEEWWLDVPFVEEVPEAEEDDFEVDEGIKTDIVLWDLFEIGQHRLLCWDSTNIDDVNKLMDGEKADMVFTDPPYWISYDNTERWGWIDKQTIWARRNKWEMIIWDSEDFNPSFILSIFSYCKEIFIWGMQYYPQHLWRWGCIVWNRKVESQKDVPHADFELCWSKQERNKMAWITWGGFKSKEKWEERLHTTQKPIELASWFLNNWGKDARIIVDIFWWSGTTMVACHQLNRKCYMSELDPKYVQTIVNRMIKLDSTLIIKRNWVPYIKPEISG